MDDPDHPPGAGREIDEAALAFPRRSPLEVTQRFQLSDNVIGRLPRHANPAREVGWPDAVGRRKTEDSEMGWLQIREPR